jgi:hypothetical protein
MIFWIKIIIEETNKFKSLEVLKIFSIIILKMNAKYVK